MVMGNAGEGERIQELVWAPVQFEMTVLTKQTSH